MEEHWRDSFVLTAYISSFDLNAEIYCFLKYIPLVQSSVSLRSICDIFSSEFADKSFNEEDEDNIPKKVARYLKRVAKYFRVWMATETTTPYVYQKFMYVVTCLRGYSKMIKEHSNKCMKENGSEW